MGFNMRSVRLQAQLPGVVFGLVIGWIVASRTHPATPDVAHFANPPRTLHAWELLPFKSTRGCHVGDQAGRPAQSGGIGKVAIYTVNFGVYSNTSTSAALRNRAFSAARCDIYDLYEVTELPSIEAVVAYSGGMVNAAKLSKYLVAEALLEVYAAVVYIDADATIRRAAPGCPELPDFVTPLLRHHPSASLFLDTFGAPPQQSSLLDQLNTGVFMMRATPWAKEFIRKVVLHSNDLPMEPTVRIGGAMVSFASRPGYAGTFDQRTIIDLLSRLPSGEVDSNVHFTRPTLSSLVAWAAVHPEAVILHAVGTGGWQNISETIRDLLAKHPVPC